MLGSKFSWRCALLSYLRGPAAYFKQHKYTQLAFFGSISGTTGITLLYKLLPTVLVLYVFIRCCLI